MSPVKNIILFPHPISHPAINFFHPHPKMCHRWPSHPRLIRTSQRELSHLKFIDPFEQRVQKKWKLNSTLFSLKNAYYLSLVIQISHSFSKFMTPLTLLAIHGLLSYDRPFCLCQLFADFSKLVCTIVQHINCCRKLHAACLMQTCQQRLAADTLPSRPTSRSRKPLRLADDILRLASRR